MHNDFGLEDAENFSNTSLKIISKIETLNFEKNQISYALRNSLFQPEKPVK